MMHIIFRKIWQISKNSFEILLVSPRTAQTKLTKHLIPTVRDERQTNFHTHCQGAKWFTTLKNKLATDSNKVKNTHNINQKFHFWVFIQIK